MFTNFYTLFVRANLKSPISKSEEFQRHISDDNNL